MARSQNTSAGNLTRAPNYIEHERQITSDTSAKLHRTRERRNRCDQNVVVSEAGDEIMKSGVTHTGVGM
jgi:hypothetical protein